MTAYSSHSDFAMTAELQVLPGMQRTKTLIGQLDPPLAVLAEEEKAMQRARREAPSGGMAVNSTSRHLAHPHLLFSPYLPCGDVRTGGQGTYPGEHGFGTFSHQRAVLTETPRSGVHFMCPPYGRPLPQLLHFLERQSGSRGG